jgi:hypothetical protein
MAQIQAGTSYATGMAVTAANLNAHVNDAILKEPCIGAQPVSQAVSATDNILISNGSALNKTTLASIISPLNLFDKSQAQSLSQNLSMVSGADFALSSSSIISLSAGAQIDLSSGAQIALSSGAILTLGQNPISNLQAATKEYVDSSISAGTTKTVAKLRIRTSPNPTAQSSTRTDLKIPAVFTRTANSTDVTITINNATYWTSPSTPFFLQGQYVSVSESSATGPLANRTYEILSVNFAAKTITVLSSSDPSTVDISGNCNLFAVYVNANPPPLNIDQNGNVNIKSVYVDLTSEKYYINYWRDSETQDMTSVPQTQTANPTLLTTSVFGNALIGSTTTPTLYSAIIARKIEAPISNQSINNPDSALTGYGITSKGIQIVFPSHPAITTNGIYDGIISVIR